MPRLRDRNRFLLIGFKLSPLPEMPKSVTIRDSDNVAIIPHSKTLDKFTISCHNPHEVPSNPPRLTPTAKLNQEERK